MFLIKRGFSSGTNEAGVLRWVMETDALLYHERLWHSNRQGDWGNYTS